MIKAILISALLAASPLAAAPHDMGNSSDLAKKVKDYLVIVNRDSSDINFYEMSTGKSNRVFLGKYANPHMAVITPDYRSVVVTGQGTNMIYVVDTESLKVRASFPGHGEPFANVDEVIRANLEQAEQRSTRLIEELRQDGAITLYELAERMYPRALRRRFWQIVATIQGQLDVLEEAGQAAYAEGRWSV